MIISIIGPSGSGKGTQAKKLAEKLNLPAVSVGQILRDECKKKTNEGLKAKEYLDRGRWVPVDIFMRIVTRELERRAYKDGFIIDGAPRRLEELHEWERYLSPRGQRFDLVIHLKTSDETSIQRIKKRAAEAQIKGDELRSDVSEKAIRARLKEYHRTIAPLLKYLKRKGVLLEINNEPPIEEVFAAIVSSLPKGLP
jgi:adenylate kinase